MKGYRPCTRPPRDSSMPMTQHLARQVYGRRKRYGHDEEFSPVDAMFYKRASVYLHDEFGFEFDFPHRKLKHYQNPLDKRRAAVRRVEHNRKEAARIKELYRTDESFRIRHQYKAHQQYQLNKRNDTILKGRMNAVVGMIVTAIGRKRS